MRLRRNWDLLGVVLLVLAALPAASLLPKTLVLVPRPGYMDDDWHVDEVFKLSRGIWVGRDVAFTHGPLFQWLSSLPARAMGVTTGAVHATWNTVPVWCAVVLVYLTLRLLLPQQPSWRRFLLLLLICIFWSPSLRTALAAFVFAATLRLCYAALEQRLRPYVAGLIAAALMLIGFLLAADTGAFAVAAVLIACVGVAFEFHRDPRALAGMASLLIAVVAFGLLLAIAVNAVMAAPFDFRFWRESLTIIQVYRWATSFPMTSAGAVQLGLALLLAAAIFILGAFPKLRTRATITRRPGFLVGGSLFCLAALQSAVVRADEHHIAVAIAILAILSGAILFSFDSKILAVGAAVVAVAISVGLSRIHIEASPTYTFEEIAFAPIVPRYVIAQLRRPLKECPLDFVEFDRGCFAHHFGSKLEAGASFLQQQSSPQDYVAIFPYQTRYGLAARRNVAGGLMQAYTASGPTLSQLEIAGLARATPVAALYFPDPDLEHMTPAEVDRWTGGDLSVPVDAVANFTRTPEVWFWLQRHYHAEREIVPGMIGLIRDDARAQRITTTEQSLELAAKTYVVNGRVAQIDLGAPAWPKEGDFIRLRLKVNYPFWWRLRKPERLQLELTRADGSRQLQWFVIAPNQTSDIWFYPWQRPALAHYFDPDPSRWRGETGSAIVSLKLLVTPLDWVSQQPSSVTLETAEAVSLQMSQ